MPDPTRILFGAAHGLGILDFACLAFAHAGSRRVNPNVACFRPERGISAADDTVLASLNIENTSFFLSSRP